MASLERKLARRKGFRTHNKKLQGELTLLLEDFTTESQNKLSGLRSSLLESLKKLTDIDEEIRERNRPC